MDLTHLFDHLRRRWNANTTPEPPRHPNVTIAAPTVFIQGQDWLKCNFLSSFVPLYIYYYYSNTRHHLDETICKTFFSFVFVFQLFTAIFSNTDFSWCD